MRAKVLAIANCKGGSGKTTTAVNLAAELAARRHAVLVVDLDSQAHSGFGLGVAEGDPAATAHQAFRQADFPIENAIRPSRVERIDVLPADRDFAISGVRCGLKALSQALARVKDRYDFIVIDTPPAADIPLVAALAAADCALVPSQLTPLAHDGLLYFSRLFFKVGASLNPGLASFSIVPIQIDMRTHVQQETLAKLLMDFGPSRIFRGIRPDVAVAEAFGSHSPVRDYRPKSRGAIDYDFLANDVVTAWAA